MEKDGVVIDAGGKIVGMRIFPPGRKEDQFSLGDGWYMIRLVPDQIGVVQIGWRTRDGGKTFTPH